MDPDPRGHNETEIFKNISNIYFTNVKGKTSIIDRKMLIFIFTLVIGFNIIFFSAVPIPSEDEVKII